MKYLCLLIVLFCSIQLMGQPYLNETSVWKQFRHYSGNGFALTDEELIIQLDGDTIIGGVKYYKVLKTGISITSYQYGPTLDPVVIYKYLDPIREEDQFFYAFNVQTGSEYLLYDFSAAVGDTLQTGNCQRDWVISIDTIYLGDKPLKRFHLPPPDVAQLVEGVGSTHGFFYPACNELRFANLKLQCYFQDGAFIQFDPNFDCAGLFVGVNPIPKDDFSIHPNPFSDEIEIHNLNFLHEATSVFVSNMLGHKVFEKQLIQGNAIQRIDLLNLPNGIYIISLRHNRGIASYKMMKL